MTASMTAVVLVGLIPVPVYEFVPAPDRLVGIMRRDGTILIGKFDADGEFTQTAVEKAGPRLGPMTWQFVGSSGSLKPELVYELRSGTLILGTLTGNGPFIPKVGAAVIRFVNYKYSPSAPRIWNLPGYFYAVPPGEKRPVYTPPQTPYTPLYSPKSAWPETPPAHP